MKRAVLAAEAALEPELTAEREEEARLGRRVSVRPEPDGMASLWALLPAEQLRVFADGHGRAGAAPGPGRPAGRVDRTADQRRADVLALLPALALHALDGTAPHSDGSHPAVVVSVHVPMATALGLSDAPGHLEGYGPVSAGTVRLMLPSARAALRGGGRADRRAGARREPDDGPGGPRPSTVRELTQARRSAAVAVDAAVAG